MSRALHTFNSIPSFSPMTIAMAETRTRDALSLNDLRLAASIVLSALFYFFDFVTNIQTVVTYYRIEYVWDSYPGPGQTYRGYLHGMFTIVMCVMIAAHIGSAVVFVFNVETVQEAMKAAFLLPLIHLRRLGLLLWRKGSLRGVSGIASEELSSVYNVLAAAMEAAPQIFIQLNVLRSLITNTSPGYRYLPRDLEISVVASFLSVIYNCSQATALAMRKAHFKDRALAGVISGVYSSSALVVRYIAVEALLDLISYIGTFSAGMMMCSIYICVTVGIPALTFWRAMGGDGRAASPAKRLLASVAYAYMSILIGPLFVLLNLTTNHHHRPPSRSSQSYQGKLLALSMVYILPDVLLFILFLFKIFQGAQMAIQSAIQGYVSYLDNYPCGDDIGANPFCGVGTMIGFECAVAVHVVSIFLVISFDKYSKNKEDEKAENSLSHSGRALINENEIRGSGAREARISISGQEQGKAFIYNRAEGCIL